MTELSLSKWEEAISRLLEFTQDGKLEWDVVSPDQFLRDEDITGAVLLVKYKEKYLLLYSKAYWYVTGNIGNVLAAFSGQSEKTKGYRPELSVYDMTEEVIVYKFPYSELVDDLYKAAAYNAAKIDELISSILDENNTPS